MPPLVVLPSYSDAFSDYRPSRNAHTDLLTNKRSGVRTVKVGLSSVPRITVSLKELTTSIASLLEGQQPPLSYHRISEQVHQLVTQNDSSLSTLYTKIDAELKAYVNTIIRDLRGFVMAREKNWLSKLLSTWKEYHDRVQLLAAVCVYLDRVWCKDEGLENIETLAANHFATDVWKNDILWEKTRGEILAWVKAERDGDVTDRQVVRDIVALSKTLGTFKKLSSVYLDDLAEYYSREAQERITSVLSGGTGTAYVSWALEKEDEESERALVFFDNSDEVVKSLRLAVAQPAGEVVRPALDEAMYRDDNEALQRLYTFCSQGGLIPVFASALRSHIEERMKQLISDPANDPQMIDSTLKFKRFADGAVAQIFGGAARSAPTRAAVDRPSELISDPANDPQMNHGTVTFKRSADGAVAQIFGGAARSAPTRAAVDRPSRPGTPRARAALGGLRSGAATPTDGTSKGKSRSQLELEDAVRVGFKAGLSSRQNAPAEWIAKHLDSVMRRGPRNGEDEFNALLDEIVALVGFTPDKDVFRAFYTGGLSKRLLLNKSASDDMERNMISKLQKEMGEEFTTGDVMMKDLQLSETLVKGYQAARAKNPDEFKDHSDFTANVLTESAWPSYKLLQEGWDFKLTPALQSALDSFTSWYQTQHKNRKLSWRHQLGTVVMTTRLGGGKYEITLSLFQAVVLLLYNEEDVLTFTEVQKRTGIETSELIRTLQSLSMGKKGTRVLLKRPTGKEVNPEDEFFLNKKFTSEKIKFKINQIQQDLSKEESKETNEQVLIDRVSVLEATIVRIMKARKTLSLAQLIDAVVVDVSKRFPPDVKEIKKRVESLIEREFLARDEKERGMLTYLA